MNKIGLPSILIAAVLLAVAVIAEAQQPKKVPRIGYLAGASRSAIAFRTEAFRQGLRALGYVEGENITIDYRYAEGNFRRQKELAAELVRLNVDVMVTSGPASTRAAKEASATIPIVMAFDSDPVGNGFIASLWGQYYGTINSCAGDKRQTIGAFEGDRS
jgi:putative ABC transport system substrate-binding protein